MYVRHTQFPKGKPIVQLYLSNASSSKLQIQVQIRFIIPLHIHFCSLLRVSHSCGGSPDLSPCTSYSAAQGSRSSAIIQSQHFCFFLYMSISATHVWPTTISLLFITKILIIRVLPLVILFPTDNL